MEVSLLENSADVSRNSGKTLMLETLYKYKKCDQFGNESDASSSRKSTNSMIRRGQAEEKSTVFRP